MKLIKVFFILFLGIISNVVIAKADGLEAAKKALSDLSKLCRDQGFEGAMNVLNGATPGRSDKLAQAEDTGIRSNKIFCIHNSKMVANTFDPLSVNKEADVTTIQNKKGVFPYQEMIKALKNSKDETAVVEIADEDPTLKVATEKKYVLFSKKKLLGKTEFSGNEKKEKFFCAVAVAAD